MNHDHVILLVELLTSNSSPPSTKSHDHVHFQFVTLRLSLSFVPPTSCSLRYVFYFYFPVLLSFITGTYFTGTVTTITHHQDDEAFIKAQETD
jgi:hypothetical protein